jgi:hypothetical protein
MSFDARDIHRPLDVFSQDNVYLGSVLGVVAGKGTMSDRHTPEAADRSSTVSGELLGPMPTEALGNPGPRNQDARSGYRAHDDGAQPLGDGAIVVGRWWGLRGRRTIPVSQVLGLSLERITLKLTAQQFGTLVSNRRI